MVRLSYAAHLLKNETSAKRNETQNHVWKVENVAKIVASRHDIPIVFPAPNN